MSKIVIALGGNALGDTPDKQREAVNLPAKQIAKLVSLGHTVVVGHGNGPQVGMIFNAFSDAMKIDFKIPYIPFAEAGGMSQGYIGLALQTAINNELWNIKSDKQALYILTQTIVDKKDPAFNNPTKPVGPFFKTKNAALEAYGKDASVMEDAGRGFRKVVPSPRPIDFVAIEAIKTLVKNKDVVIAGGGGGVPTIIDKNEQYKSVDGVIDKDFALSKLAQIIEADTFIILTAVKKVFVNFNKPNQKALDCATISELKEYIKQDQFAKGSMLPKIQAAIEFVEKNPKGKAIIAHISQLEDIIKKSNNVGTIIVNK